MNYIVTKLLGLAIYHTSRINYSLFLLLLLVSLSLFLRLYHFENRIYIESDNTRDVQVAQYALDHGKMPIIGQYSSGGPFFYGPWWYWSLMLFSLPPLGPLRQWYMSIILSFVYIGVLYKIGVTVSGKKLGFFAAFLGSISPLAIQNSLSVWNAASVPLLASLVLLSLVLYAKYREVQYAILTSFLVGLAITIHFQNMLLLPTILVLFLVKKLTLREIMLMFAAFLIPFVPLIFFDLQFNGINLKGVLFYLREGQYAIYVPNRWLTYAFSYWPQTWATILGSHKTAGFLIPILVCAAIFRHPFKSLKNKALLCTFISFAAAVILFRYYRGERFVYYSYFAHPTVLILTAWGLIQIGRVQKFIPWLFGTALIITILPQLFLSFKDAPYPLPKFDQIKNEIYATYPNMSYSVYGCLFNGNTVAHPLSYILYSEGKNSPSGKKIGVCEGEGRSVTWRSLEEREVGKENSGWRPKDTSFVFTDTVEWWVKNPPK